MQILIKTILLLESLPHARYYVKHFSCSISFDHLMNLVGSIIIPTLEMKK